MPRRGWADSLNALLVFYSSLRLLMKLILSALLASVSLLPRSLAHAQTVLPQGSSVGNGPTKTVLVRIYEDRHGYLAVFDTDGQPVAGLSEVELNKKFFKVASATSVINFVVQNGYRVAGFAPIQARTHGGTCDTGGGTAGYAVLCEQVR